MLTELSTMTLLVVHRPARTPLPAVATDPVTVAAPPQLPAGTQASSWFTYLFPVLGSAGSLVFILINPSPVYIIGGLLFALGSVGMGAGLYAQQRSSRRGQLLDNRQRYLAYLDALRRQLAHTVDEQRAGNRRRHPAPAALSASCDDRRRLWERNPNDDDFLQVRIGTGRRPLATPLSVADEGGPLTEREPVSDAALRRLLSAFSELDDLPVTVDMATGGGVSVLGSPADARALMRALIGQVATLHPPEDVRLAVCAGPQARAAWGWVKWLPHAQHPEAYDDTGPVRLVAESLDELDQLVGAELDKRRRWRRTPMAGAADRPPGAHLLVILDGTALTPGSPSLLDDVTNLGITVVQLVERAEEELTGRRVRLRIDPGRVTVEAVDGSAVPAVPDTLSLAEAEALARRLAPLRLSATTPERALVDALELPELLGVPDVAHLEPAQLWRDRPVHEQLRVPLGVDPHGLRVHLDLKESALDGMGPHGLIVGATGSGKSELLRTLVTGLALTHSPEVLSFVLVDFKGGATFAGMADLPHVAGVITNLQDDLTMVDRFHAALFGEMNRRQELLRAAGNLSSVREYAQRRAAGASLEPLPSLLVIVDEFSELLANKPDFIDLFVAIGRLGRSLGMHLLLASQRLDEGRLRGLESHLSYRIGLRTFSATESRAVLGVPDAYELPPIPGSAYLKVDVSVFQRLRAAMVSGPYHPPVGELAVAATVTDFPARNPGTAQVSQPAFEPDAEDSNRRSVMSMVVEQLRDAADKVHQVWLPPLAPAIPLDRLLGPLDKDAQRGYGAHRWPRRGQIAAPIGVVDRPGDQRQDTYVVDLSGAAGHLAVVGGPQSGKSTALRALIASFSLTHTPEEMQFYCLDFGGGQLAPLAGAPHVGTVTSRLDIEGVRRTVSEVHAVLEQRESYLATAGIDSVASLRARRAAGTLPEEEYGDVVLVVDNWLALRTAFEDLEPLILDIAARGLGYGVHLILTAARWLDIKPNLRDHMIGRLELRLGETADSVINRQEAANVPTSTPGRGLTVDGLHLQVALPRVDGESRIDDLPTALAELVEGIHDGWTGPGARPVRVLPSRLVWSDLPNPERDSEPGVPIGVSELDLAPAYVDLSGAEPHLLVLGDSESGKTMLLRGYLAGLFARCRPEQAKVLVVDYRRTLLEAVPEQFLLEYAGAAPAADSHITELCTVLTKRLPGPGVTPAQLRERSWWTGPDVYVVIDDYDLVVTPSGNPLTPLLELLPQARDIGLHVILARRTAGMARAGYEPVMTRLRELGSCGVLLSGDPSEGPLLGPYRAAPQPVGRGLLVARRRHPMLVQTAWLPSTDGD